MHAHYLDPHATKGRPLPSRVTPEEELRELELRLQQMKQIFAEYGKRFGDKSGVTPGQDRPANGSLPVVH